MQSLSRMEEQISYVMGERAQILARETGCIQRVRNLDGADLLQMLVFGWLAHPKSSLEQLASTAAIREMLMSDTAIQKRFTQECAHFLHAVLQGVWHRVLRPSLFLVNLPQKALNNRVVVLASRA